MTTSTVGPAASAGPLVRAVMGDDHALVWLAGDFDLTADDQLASVAEQLESAQLPIVVDMTEVVFADSALINFLARAARLGPLVLCNPTARVWDLVVLSGLSPLVSFVRAPGGPNNSASSVAN